MAHGHPVQADVGNAELWAFVGILIAGCWMWGGLGRFDSPESPQIGGVLRIQDLVAGASGLLLAFAVSSRIRWPRAGVVASGGILAFLAQGALVGAVFGNGAANVALEVRPILFAAVGVVMGMLRGSSEVEEKLVSFSSVLATAMVLQFILVLRSPSAPQFLSGVNVGNAFTLHIPIVRPAGGFHLVGVGFVLAALRRPQFRHWVRLSLLGMGVAVTQSKAYWAIALFAIVYGAMAGAARAKFARRFLTAIILMAGLAGVVTAIGMITLGAESGPSALVRKFSLVAENPVIQYGVLGKRTSEIRMMYDALDGTARYWVLGRGLGSVYRDPGTLFFRTDPRDRQRLAMFGHNYPMWLLVKGGILGVLLMCIPVLTLFRNTKGPSTSSGRVAWGGVLLLAAGLVLGSLEDPTSALVFGLCVGASCSFPAHEERSSRLGRAR